MLEKKLLFLWKGIAETPLWDFLKRGIRVDEKMVSYYLKEWYRRKVDFLKEPYDFSNLTTADFHLLSQILNAIPEDVKNSNENMQIFFCQSLERRARSLLRKLKQSSESSDS